MITLFFVIYFFNRPYNNILYCCFLLRHLIETFYFWMYYLRGPTSPLPDLLHLLNSYTIIRAKTYRGIFYLGSESFTAIKLCPFIIWKLPISFCLHFSSLIEIVWNWNTMLRTIIHRHWVWIWAVSHLPK